MKTTPNPEVSGNNARDVRIVVAAALWAISYLLALFFLKRGGVPEALRMWIALAPVLPFAFFLVRWISHLRKFDELQQRMHFEALAFAFPVAILLLMSLGLLERAGALPAKGWSYNDVWCYLPLFYAIGLGISWRKYR